MREAALNTSSLYERLKIASRMSGMWLCEAVALWGRIARLSGSDCRVSKGGLNDGPSAPRPPKNQGALK